MSEMTLEQEILTEVKKLNSDMQRHLLEIVRGLANPSSQSIGEPGWLFVEQTRHIHIPPEDLAEMARVIEELKNEIAPERNIDLDEYGLFNK